MFNKEKKKEKKWDFGMSNNYVNRTKLENRSILILWQKTKDLCLKIKYCIKHLSLDSEKTKKERRGKEE